MPNWCMTHMIVAGKENELKKLKALIENGHRKNMLKMVLVNNSLKTLCVAQYSR